MTKTYLLPILALFFISLNLSAQGWEQIIHNVGEDEILSVVNTPDGGFAATGYNDKQGFIRKWDAEGKTLWTSPFNILGNFANQGSSIINTSDGGFVVTGYVDGVGNGKKDLLLFKIDKNGNYLFHKTHGQGFDEVGNQLKELPNGDLLIGGFSNSSAGNKNAYLVKTDKTGNLIGNPLEFGTANEEEIKAIEIIGNQIAMTGFVVDSGVKKMFLALCDFNLSTPSLNKTLDIPFPSEGNAMTKGLDGNLVIAGSININARAFLVKVNLTGDTLWTKQLKNKESKLLGLVANPNQNAYIATGFVENTGSTNIYVVKTNANAQVLWEKELGAMRNGLDVSASIGYSVTVANQGGYFIGGSTATGVFGNANLYAIRTDEEGTIFNRILSGTVYRDVNSDCQLSSTDKPLQNWLIKAEGKQTLYATTNVSGQYELRCDTGQYKVSIVAPNSYWKTCQIYTSIPQKDTITGINFAVQASIQCPYLEVTASTPVLQRCKENLYYIKYKNTGTRPALDAYIEVALDTFLTLVRSDLTATKLSGNAYRTPIGDLYPNEEGNFIITTALSCNSTKDGQSHYLKATIFPNDLCETINPKWDKSSLDVSANKSSNEVSFELKNKGTAKTSANITYVVVEDDVILRQAPPNITLNPNQTHTERIPLTGADEKTYRIIVNQSVGHPGDSRPTAVVEGNGLTGKPFSTGYVLQFEENDANAFVDIDMQESVAAGKTLLLKGFPKGYGEENLISDSTDIEYMISFQNLGNQVINKIVIRDTLSQYLDVNSLEFGTASAPYTYEVLHTGYIKFTMEGLNLFPQSVSDLGSRGFIKFRVSQKKGNPNGTIIYNKAGVSFDNQTIQVSNRTKHKIASNFLSEIKTDTKETDFPDALLKVYPNPFETYTNFKIEGIDLPQAALKIFDIQGRLVQMQEFNGNELTFYKNNLAEGFYIYRIESNGLLVANGKVIIR